MSDQDLSDTASGPYIRPYNPSTDEEALIHIFRETADEGLKTEPAWTISSYLWARPYAKLTPETCFVLVSESDSPVGYCIGTPDTAAFARKWESEFLPTLDQDRLPRPKPDAPERSWDEDKPAALLSLVYSPRTVLNESLPGLWDKYPGHLHIDILDLFQGKGYGRKLIDTLLDGLRMQGCKGVHLGMVPTNVGAGKFYERLGFKRFPEVLDDGESGEMGRLSKGKGGTIFYCKDL